MENKVTVNGVTIDVVPITQLLEQNRKIEAVKYVFDTAKIGLKEAKDIVDKIAEGIY